MAKKLFGGNKKDKASQADAGEVTQGNSPQENKSSKTPEKPKCKRYISRVKK